MILVGSYINHSVSCNDTGRFLCVHTLITVCLVMILVGSYINHSVSCNDTGRFIH